MYHYSFSSDIRIENLYESMKKIGSWYLNDNVPSAQDDKSSNNVANTLGFYFNFRNKGACARNAESGFCDRVLLNFVKKFQYPNPRAKESGIDSCNDGIKLAPLRVILKLLNIFYLIDGQDGYITKDEVTEFIMYNSDVAKTRDINYLELYSNIKQYRKTAKFPSTIASASERAWKGMDSYNNKLQEYTQGKRKDKPSTNPELRQIGIMLNIMVLSKCIIEENEKFYFNSNVKDEVLKQYIYDILVYNEFWEYNSTETIKENEKSYSLYMEMEDIIDVNEKFEDIKLPNNRIIFGAPGTGKSYLLERDRVLFNDNYERVTFHPNYSYAQFVGTYKPVPEKIINEIGQEENIITYKYVPGPFMRIYINAIKSMKRRENKSYLLIIEEINRANVASVFGDVFQLLDRKNGESEYSIGATEDIKLYLAEQLGGDPEDYSNIKIPRNMYIWATMNSADQGVFPMDTAFKRRWNFEYIGIDENDKKISQAKVILPSKEKEITVLWNDVRKSINKKLSECKVNEDKLMGPFFLSNEILEEDEHNIVNDMDRFKQAFKSKVLMYLYEDAAKQYKHKIFIGCDYSRYSSVCNAFDEIGIDIFGDLGIKIERE